MVARKYFSIQEAEHILPEITPKLKKAQRLKERLENYEVISAKRITTEGSLVEETELDGTLDSEFQFLKERFYKTIEDVEEKGCIIRNLDSGVIDFYTKFEGRDVFLCWELGAHKIKFWHEVDEDFTGRKRILEM